MSLIDILQPALKAYGEATDGRTPLEQAIDQAHQDPRVRLAMRIGAGLEGGNLVGGWGAGDGGTSFGPFQIHLPAHADVTRAQAEDPYMAVQVMAPEYADAVEQVPAEMWQDDPYNAAVLASYYAERPLHFYGSEQITAAKTQVSGGGNMGTPDKTPVPAGTPGPGGGSTENGTPVPGGFNPSDFGGSSGKITVKQYHGHFYVYDGAGNIISDSVTQPSPMELATLANETTSANANRTSASASLENAASASMNAATSSRNADETARQNKVQDQIDYITRLTAAAQADDARAQNSKTNELAALPFIVNAAKYQTGLAPNDYAVRAGLASASPNQAVPFQPDLPPGQYTDQLAALLEKLGVSSGAK